MTFVESHLAVGRMVWSKTTPPIGSAIDARKRRCISRRKSTDTFIGPIVTFDCGNPSLTKMGIDALTE
jgi:hypothetical protein